MKRTRQYRRNMRRSAIGRKSSIKRFLLGEADYAKYQEACPSGSLDKGKVHCSCRMCREKSYDNLSARDRRRSEDKVEPETYTVLH